MACMRNTSKKPLVEINAKGGIEMTKIGYKEIKNKGNYESETFWVETEITSNEETEILKEGERVKSLVKKMLGGVNNV